MLVDNGATLQLGIGKIPDATLSYLGKHENLGIHSEMISDGVIELIQSGVINNQILQRLNWNCFYRRAKCQLRL